VRIGDNPMASSRLDGLDAARGRADQDRNATVRKWTPPSELTHPTLL
jgi:hypothetical protein